MSRISFIVGLTLAVSCGPAFAQNTAASQPCYSDKISNSSGLAVRMSSGQRFQAYPGSSGRMATWQPLDDVKICYLGGAAVQITNLSKKDQQVNALRK